MKKILIITAVLALSLCLAAAAPAASGPPKTLCLYFVTVPTVTISLVIKLTGTLQTSAGPVKYYTLSGEMNDATAFYSFPVTGTGHMNGAKFHFSLTGPGFFNEAPPVAIYDIAATDFDLVAGGSVVLRSTIDDNVGSSFTYTLAPKDCKASVFTFDAEGEAPPGPDLPVLGE